MDIINKKRDEKTHDKKKFSKGKKGTTEDTKTVDFFKAGDDQVKERKHVGDKRTSKKFVPKKDDSDKIKKGASPYANKDIKKPSTGY